VAGAADVGLDRALSFKVGGVVDTVAAGRMRYLKHSESQDRVSTTSWGVQPALRFEHLGNLRLSGEWRREDTEGPRETRTWQTTLAGAPAGTGTLVTTQTVPPAWRSVWSGAAYVAPRFGRDGRLLQTFRAGTGALPSGIALADGGNLLLQADGALGQWSELRAVGSLAVPVRPERPAGPVHIDAIALGPGGVYVLDRLAGAVHRVQRDGRIVQTLGAGELQQPVALAVDRIGRKP